MMDLKKLFSDDDAVSPVIGVILMVAITVILAAVIGAFVLNIGGSQEQVPQASWAADYSSDASGNNVLTVSQDGGSGVDASTLSVSVAGTEYWDGSATSEGAAQTESSDFTYNTDQWYGNTISAGDKLEITEDTGTFGSGDVEIVWSSSSSDDSQIIFESPTAF